MLGKVQGRKVQLLAAIAGKNRGLISSPTQPPEILALIEQVERQNPTPKPLGSKLIGGNWRLLYTTSDELLGIDRFPFLKLGQIYQYIQADQGRLYNVAEVLGIPYLEGFVSVVARFESNTPKRVTVQFERLILGLQRWTNYQSPEQFVGQAEDGKKFLPIDLNLKNQERQGWVDVTYLDEDLRISRGNEGSVFVLTRY